MEERKGYESNRWGRKELEKRNAKNMRQRRKMKGWNQEGKEGVKENGEDRRQG